MSPRLLGLFLPITLAVVASCAPSQAADAVWGGNARLASDGQALQSVMVAPQAAPRIKEAAESLAATLSRISGATFKVQHGDGRRGLAVGLPGDFAAAGALGHFDLNEPTRRED